MEHKTSPLVLREEVIFKIRNYFYKKNYQEIWVNSLVSSPAIEPYLDAFLVPGKKNSYFLATSPEFALKKRFSLLPKSVPGVFAISPAFRDDPKTPYHAPEFTMVEWYFREGNLEKLAQECYALMEAVFLEKIPKKVFLSLKDFFLDEKIFLPKNIENYFSLEFYEKSTIDDLDRAQKEFEIFFHEKVRPRLKQREEILFLYGFPAFLRGMAKVKDGLALKVECFYGGIELANGYEEENSIDEIKKLFSYCNAIRQKRNLPTYPVDEFLLFASQKLNQVAGMALGLERMLMVFKKIPDISVFFI